jgi:geranylgeranyl diphosphate synthase type II
MHESWDVEQSALRDGKPPSVRAPVTGPSSFDLDDYLSARQAQVEALLLARLDGLPFSASPLLRRALRYSLLAESQRMRAVLCLAFAEAITGARVPPRAVEDAACALELIQTCSLIYDDLLAMDAGAPRRGRPAHLKAFGESMASQACDALILEAFHLLSRGPEPVRSRLSSELAAGTGLMGMPGGQVPDIVQDRDARLEYLLQLHRMKTGGFIRASCRMGALAAGGDEETLARADIYGDAVGVAFLIGDDLRDVTSDAATPGKPNGTNTVVGRLNFATVVGLQTSRTLAVRKVAEAIAAIEPLEGANGPLAVIARSTLER